MDGTLDCDRSTDNDKCIDDIAAAFTGNMDTLSNSTWARPCQKDLRTLSSTCCPSIPQLDGKTEDFDHTSTEDSISELDTHRNTSEAALGTSSYSIDKSQICSQANETGMKYSTDSTDSPAFDICASEETGNKELTFGGKIRSKWKSNCQLTKTLSKSVSVKRKIEEDTIDYKRQKTEKDISMSHDFLDTKYGHTTECERSERFDNNAIEDDWETVDIINESQEVQEDNCRSHEIMPSVLNFSRMQTTDNVYSKNMFTTILPHVSDQMISLKPFKIVLTDVMSQKSQHEGLYSDSILKANGAQTLNTDNKGCDVPDQDGQKKNRSLYSPVCSGLAFQSGTEESDFSNSLEKMSFDNSINSSLSLELFSPGSSPSSDAQLRSGTSEGEDVNEISVTVNQIIDKSLDDSIQLHDADSSQLSNFDNDVLTKEYQLESQYSESLELISPNLVSIDCSPPGHIDEVQMCVADEDGMSHYENDHACPSLQSSALSDSDNKICVMVPSMAAPSRKAVTDSLSEFNLQECKHAKAFYSNEEDVPTNLG